MSVRRVATLSPRMGWPSHASPSTDQSWSVPVSKSKFSGVRLPDGRYVLVSNPHPTRRDPLTLAISADGLVFTAMGYLVGGRHVDYPHVIHHEGSLYVAFATAKSTVEVLQIRVADLDGLKNPPLQAAK